MRCGLLAAVTRYCTIPRRTVHAPTHCLNSVISQRISLAMSAAFSTFDKPDGAAANGDKTSYSSSPSSSSSPLTPPAPLSPDDRNATTASAFSATAPLPTSSCLLPSNTAGGTSSSFLHSLASRLQGARGELAGRALSAPAHHSTVTTRVHSPSAGLDLSKLQQPSLNPPRPLVVLLACGSYSPVTSMHLLLFETAKNFLMYETAALDVVGGLISPVHDNYGKPSLVPAHHRISMTRAATASSTWIATSAWETLQPGWTTTCATMAAYSRFITATSLYPTPPRLVLLCGADLLESTQVRGLWADEDLEVILGEYGVAVIERVGLDLERLIADDERLRRWRHHIWIVPQRVVNNVSSTVVRNMIRDGFSIEYLVEAKVRDYIYQHALFGHDRERERRRQQKPVVRPLLVNSEETVEEERVDGDGDGESEVSGKRVSSVSGVGELPPVLEHVQRNNQT